VCGVDTQQMGQDVRQIVAELRLQEKAKKLGMREQG
jgi:hypothetical protein